MRRALATALALGAGLAAAWPAGAQDPLLCREQVPTILGTPGPDTITGTPGRDVIYADAGDDQVSGEATGDVICGGLGNDRIGGGGGNDRISGDDGADILQGDRGNDRLDAGPGDADSARGGLGDDTVNGGLGNGDEVLGDLGIDEVNGNGGDFDLVRGDYGADTMSGGAGVGDIASFATTIPDRTGPSVTASLADGTATGDGRDTLAQFEDLEGSAFSDMLSGDGGDNRVAGGPGNDQLEGGGGTDTGLGGPGSDVCNGFATTTSCGDSRRPPAAAVTHVAQSLAGGGGLTVVGRGDDRLSVAMRADGSFLVRSAKAPLGPRQGCRALGRARRTVICRVPAPVRYLLVDLGPGDDRLTLEGGLLAAGAVRVGGGPGDDAILGGEEDDHLQAGEGFDRLYGGAGADGLLGDADTDLLFGQLGDDLLAAGGPCGGGRLVGNDGDDNASFARTAEPRAVLEASLEAGVAFIRGAEDCQRTQIAASVEDLEGTFGRDVLIGDAGDNSFFGQPGADEFYGRAGNDLINARDGRVDRVIDCGEGEGDVATVDATDPEPIGCEPGTAERRRRAG